MATLVVRLLNDGLQTQDWLTFRIRIVDTLKQYNVSNAMYGEDWDSGNRCAIYFISDIPSQNLPALKMMLGDLAQFFNQSNLTVVEGIMENVA